MSRRTLSLVLASLIAVLLTAGAVQARVPYVALGPGPTYDTLGEFDGEPLLEIEGRPTYPTTGHLDLTTVGVQARLTLVQALVGWFDRELAVVPREVVFPPGRTDDEVEQANAEAMTSSQDTAAAAAARQLGYRTAQVSVLEVPEGTPAQGRLEEGDLITSLDGKRVRDAADLRALIGRKDVGEVVRVGYRRSGEEGSVEIRTAASADDGERRPVIGVVTEETPIDPPFSVTVTLEEVGGPSAGLMFALGIVDKLDEPSLTGGKHIAGTGELERDGSVGSIGGISQKLIAAKEKGAEVFLVPADNCAEAVLNAPEDLPLVEVGTLDEAVTALEAVRSGEQPELCPAA